MNVNEHLLTCLIEECAEVQKHATKALRFGLDDREPGQAYTNAERIADELIDVFAVIDLIVRAGLVVNPVDVAAFTKKQAKVRAWMDHARETGALT